MTPSLASLIRLLYLLCWGMWRNECAITVEGKGRVRIEAWYFRKGDPLRRTRVFFDGPGVVPPMPL